VVFGSDLVEIFTTPDDFRAVRDAFEGRGINLQSAEITLVPKTTIELDDKKALQNMNLITTLEDLDDVQQVYSNLDITDELMALFENES